MKLPDQPGISDLGKRKNNDQATRLMASHKNQHYVPRCYLKQFCVDDEGAAINLYNIDRKKGISNAPVRSQCSGSYFYGDDLKLERALQKIETPYAQAVREIEELGYRLTDQHRNLLSQFCFLQHCRTDAMSKRAALFISEMTDTAYKGSTPTEYRINIRDAVLMGMKSFLDMRRIVSDLKVCLVRNRSSVPFVTSDDPAVMTNRWYAQDKRARGQSGGAGAAGVLFILPLSPETMCLLYDGDVYSIPNKAGWVTIDDPADARAFNEHQFLGCVANVYFRDWDSVEIVGDHFRRIAARRPASRHEVHVAILDSEDEWGKRYRVVPREELPAEGEGIIHMRSIDPKPSRWPSLIKWRTGQKIYSNGSGTGFVRRWCIDSGFIGGQGYRKITGGR